MGGCWLNELAAFGGDELHEVRRLEQRGVRADVEPRRAAPEDLDAQLTPSEIRAVDVGDLELAPL